MLYLIHVNQYYPEANKYMESFKEREEKIMINVSSKALNYLCKAYQIKDSDLTFLGGGREDSDGIAYSYYLEGHKKVLKILAVDKPGNDDLKALEDRLAFVHYLGT